MVKQTCGGWELGIEGAFFDFSYGFSSLSLFWISNYWLGMLEFCNVLYVKSLAADFCLGFLFSCVLFDTWLLLTSKLTGLNGRAGEKMVALGPDNSILSMYLPIVLPPQSILVYFALAYVQ